MGRRDARERAGQGGRKPMPRALRRVAGCTVTVENGRGLDLGMIRAALAEAMGRIDAEAEEQAAGEAA